MRPGKRNWSGESVVQWASKKVECFLHASEADETEESRKAMVPEEEMPRAADLWISRCLRDLLWMMWPKKTCLRGSESVG